MSGPARSRWWAGAVPLVGLPILFALGMGPGRQHVQDELEERTTAALHEAGITDLQVRARGRDVHLQGAVDESVVVEAHRIARAQRGVRHVFDPPAADLTRGTTAAGDTASPPATPVAPSGDEPTSTTATTDATGSTGTTGAPDLTTTTTTAPPTTTTAPTSTTAAPPSTAPTTTEPSPPATSAVTTLSFSISYDPASDTPNSAGQAALDAAVAAARSAAPGTRVTITGYTDPTGDAAINQQLARRRAERVGTALAAANGSLAHEVHSSTDPGTTDLVAARRVEVVIG